MDGMGGVMVERDARGRFAPGASGNPAGKKPGTRNRASMLAAALTEGEGAAIARQVIEAALAGNGVAARFCLDRLCPRPRGRAITLDLPEITGTGAAIAAYNAGLRAMAAGEITPAEAVEIARFLERRLRLLQAWQLERRLTRYDDDPVPGDGGAEEREEEDEPGCLAQGDEPSPVSGRGQGEGETPTKGNAPRRHGDHGDIASGEIRSRETDFPCRPCHRGESSAPIQRWPHPSSPDGLGPSLSRKRERGWQAAHLHFACIGGLSDARRRPVPWSGAC
jgi:hypothetical protein